MRRGVGVRRRGVLDPFLVFLFGWEGRIEFECVSVGMGVHVRAFVCFWRWMQSGICERLLLRTFFFFGVP